MKEYNLEIDDVRWYLSVQQARRLLEYKDRVDKLAQLIWSKQLDSDLYDMEERFLAEMKEQQKQNRVDESRLREIFGQMRREKEKRFSGA